MRDGLGCTLTTIGSDSQLPVVKLPTVQDKPIKRASLEELANAFDIKAVDEALERAFTPQHHTLAVAVLHRGRLAAERYAADIDADTVLPGWSMAKSMTATLVGLLVERGRLDVHQPGIVPEWRSGKDGGDQVTLDHLLRMTGGLMFWRISPALILIPRCYSLNPMRLLIAANRGINICTRNALGIHERQHRAGMQGRFRGQLGALWRAARGSTGKHS